MTSEERNTIFRNGFVEGVYKIFTNILLCLYFNIDIVVIYWMCLVV